jgi:hypothetical protein
MNVCVAVIVCAYVNVCMTVYADVYVYVGNRMNGSCCCEPALGAPLKFV